VGDCIFWFWLTRAVLDKIQRAVKLCVLWWLPVVAISADSDIASCLAKAGCAFGKLQKRLTGVHDVSREAKVAVYQVVVITTLLYVCETWTLYGRSVRRLDQFHILCLRKIAGIKWQDRVTNTDVLHMCGTTGIEAFLLKAQLRWVGHVMCMPDSRVPKQVFCGQLAVGSRPQCGPVRRYEDTVFTLPYLTFGVDSGYLPTAEAISVWPNGHPRCNCRLQ